MAEWRREQPVMPFTELYIEETQVLAIQEYGPERGRQQDKKKPPTSVKNVGLRQRYNRR